MQNTNNSKTQWIAKVAIAGAMAAVLMIFQLPLPFTPPFYQLDFSEVIVLLSGFALGPLAAICIEAIKILLNLLFNGTSTMGVGEIANFIIGCSFVLPATIIYKKHKTRKNAIIGMGVGTICLCLIGCLVNYYVLLPVYASVYNMPISALVALGHQVNSNINSIFQLVILAVLPFNMLKGVAVSLICLPIYKRISPILHH